MDPHSKPSWLVFPKHKSPVIILGLQSESLRDTTINYRPRGIQILSLAAAYSHARAIMSIAIFTVTGAIKVTGIMANGIRHERMTVHDTYGAT